MRYDKGHKDGTRQHIVEVAARKFREEGVASAGIAGLMAEAGLTNGAFYNHFDSKDHLVREALEHALGQTARRYEEAPFTAEEWIRGYLSPTHRDSPGQGCAVAALVGELARQPEATRAGLTASLGRTVERITAGMGGEGTPEERERRALAIFGLMAGTLQLARAVTDRELSDRILAGGLETALGLMGKPAG
nr:TetR/AcrR family transcriptional regulator [uncultured Roseococcus sp.]